MMIKQELVKKIKEHFDLNIYETKVWISLLSKGIASAGEIAQISSIPRSRTYDALESLEKRGFAITKIGMPVKYIAVKPTEVLEKMKSVTMQEAQEKVNGLSNLKTTSEYEELELLHKNGISPIKTHEITGSLKGRSNIVAKMRELIQNTEKELLILTTVSDFDNKSRVLIPSLEDALKKDIKVKVALSGNLDKIKKLISRLNIKINNANSESRMYVSDKKEIMFMITPENSDEEIAIWLNSPFFANAVSNLLNAHIKNGNA